jgi:hypothetical protein
LSFGSSPNGHFLLGGCGALRLHLALVEPHGAGILIFGVWTLPTV